MYRNRLCRRNPLKCNITCSFFLFTKLWKSSKPTFKSNKEGNRGIPLSILCLWFSCLQAFHSYYLNVAVEMKFNSFVRYKGKTGRWSVTSRKWKTNTSAQYCSMCKIGIKLKAPKIIRMLLWKELWRPPVQAPVWVTTAHTTGGHSTKAFLSQHPKTSMDGNSTVPLDNLLQCHTIFQGKMFS